MPTLFAHCEHCMQVMHGTGLMPYSEQLEEYPEDVKKQYFELSGVALKVRDEFGVEGNFNKVSIFTQQNVRKQIAELNKKTEADVKSREDDVDQQPSQQN